MTDLIRINSTLVSASSCSFKFAGIPFVGILSLDYEEKREPKIVHGARRDGLPLGWTTGKYDPGPVTFRMLNDSFDKLTTLLTPLGLGSYGDAEFPFIAQYIEPGIGQLPITVVMAPCRVTGVKDGFAAGNDELTTEVTMHTLSITRNGKRLWSVVRSIPL